MAAKPGPASPSPIPAGQTGLPGAWLRADPAFAAGVAQFNAGDYYGCHETLETLWLARREDLSADGEAERLCLQGLIQLAVALYKWQQGNRRGALFLRERALLKWSGLPERFAGIDLAALRAAMDRGFAPLLATPAGALAPADGAADFLPPVPAGAGRLQVHFTAGGPA